jgi:hypothetical protein
MLMNSDKVDFGLVDKHAKQYEVPGRTKSAALLIWFLETIYRLDENRIPRCCL